MAVKIQYILGRPFDTAINGQDTVLHHRMMDVGCLRNVWCGRTVCHVNIGCDMYVATEDAPLGSAELVFSSLPHGASKQWVEAAQDSGARVVDLSHDLRPGNGCDGTPYGLTELNRDQIRDALVVANPGCYPTSVLMALAPAVAAGIIAPGSTVQVSSASGVTGAGNSPKRELLFGEVSEDFRAYGVGNTHRHLNEMRATLSTNSRFFSDRKVARTSRDVVIQESSPRTRTMTPTVMPLKKTPKRINRKRRGNEYIMSTKRMRTLSIHRP